MVQGCADASRKSQELIEKILMHPAHGLCLKSNRADPCFYSGTIDVFSALLSRETDDLLVSASKAVYVKILVTMKGADWKIHDNGLASFFFGICICQSDHGISIDQAPYASLTLFLAKIGLLVSNQVSNTRFHCLQVQSVTLHL